MGRNAVKELIAAAALGSAARGSYRREREDRAHRVVAFLRRTVAAAINRLSSDSVLLLGYHMGGA